MTDNLAPALRALDSITGAQSGVIDAELELVCGDLPDAIKPDELKWTETSSWREIGGHDILMIRLRGHASAAHWIVSCFDQVTEAKRPALETLYRLARSAESNTERVARELDMMRRMFQSVLDTIPVRVFWKDRDSVYLGSNRLFAADAGFDSPDELIGITDREMGFREQAEAYRADDRQVMTSGRAKIDYEEPQTTPTGDRIWLQTSKIPLRDGHGEVFGVLGTYADITPRKEAEAEREKLLAELESKNSELERFSYTVSHDLKSPLVTIGGFLGLLERDLRRVCPTEDQDKLLGYFERIRKASFKMTELLEELLTMSRVGRILRPLEPVELRSLIDDAMLLCAGGLREAGAEVRIQGQFPVVHADGPRIVQVIQNLLDNACKYRRPDKPLIIGISAREDGCLTVEDNGIGIPKSYHGRIFEIFEKLDGTTEGNGIGLALVQRIVEAHGGAVSVESSGKGHGTTFRIVLPRPPDHA